MKRGVETFIPGDTSMTIWFFVGLGTGNRSYRTTILMNVPYTAVHFSVYETAKRFLGQAHGLKADEDLDQLEESLTTHLLAGGSAGGVNPRPIIRPHCSHRGSRVVQGQA